MLIAVNVAVFSLVQQRAGVQEVAVSLGLIPAVVNGYAILPAAAIWVPEDATYLSYAFLHGSALHLIGNMLFLWVFGDNIEDALGHVRYFIFYIACAVAAGLAHAVFFNVSESPLVGASGAVAGVVTAYLILHPKIKVWVLAFGKIPLRISAMWCLGAWIALQVFQLLFNSESQVSWISHVGGIVTGFILILCLKRRDIALFDGAFSNTDKG